MSFSRRHLTILSALKRSRLPVLFLVFFHPTASAPCSSPASSAERVFGCQAYKQRLRRAHCLPFLYFPSRGEQRQDTVGVRVSRLGSRQAGKLSGTTLE